VLTKEIFEMKGELFFKAGILVVLTFNYLMLSAQQQQPYRKDLLNTIVSQKVSIVEIKEVTIAEGQAVPKHLHPCPVVGYVVSGTVFFQVEGKESRVLKGGDAFYEPKNKSILHFENSSKDKPLIFVAFYLKENNEEIIKIIKD
jgi:quercetin dioxygenase-like cupin family protein